MLAVIKSDVITDLSRVHVPTAEELAEMEAQKQAQADAMHLNLSHADFDSQLLTENTYQPEDDVQIPATEQQSIVPPASRNAPCPCGSGLKYKQCHGKI